RWCERSAGHHARLVTVAEDSVALPCDHLAVVGAKADQFFPDPVAMLHFKSFRADKRASEFYESSQSSFERRRIAIEFVTVQRQARFEPKRIAGTESDRLDIRRRATVENRFEQLRRADVFREKLEAVFSS